MRGTWWKLLSVLLMFYVLFAGMLVPLKSGVQSVRPQAVAVGETATLEIGGYNTHFDAGSPPRVWLKLNADALADGGALGLAASEAEVVDAQTLRATFVLPRGLPTGLRDRYASVIVDNVGDGTFVMPSSVAVTGDEGGSAVYGAAWATRLDDFSASEAFTFPYRALLGETIRNQYFHVSLWFALMILMLAAAIYAGRFLRSGRVVHDDKSEALTRAGFLFGLLGLGTGMIWANYTWGAPWSGDVKQNMTAVALLIYLAYFVLRASVGSADQARRVGAAYNLFAFAMLIPLLYVIPRMRESLHPGAGGNPGFGGEDLDSTMRAVFYPGIVGFTLVGLWLAQLWWRVRRVGRRAALAAADY